MGARVLNGGEHDICVRAGGRGDSAAFSKLCRALRSRDWGLTVYGLGVFSATFPAFR